jgi:glycosyltransferase involved in cell wall biosynthesis
MRQTITNTGMKDYVHLLGYVDDQDLPALYSASRMLLMPSLYEGFGLPVLEAMACGVPVITSKTSSLPEVGGDAAILIEPTNPAEIRDAMLAVETNVTLREQMVQKGYRQAKSFTWRRNASQLLSVYQSLLDG